jgi:hypothetical protein
MRNLVEPVEPARVHKSIIVKIPAFRIQRDAIELIAKIFRVSDAMAMESRLPHFTLELFTHRKRKPTFYALSTPFNGLSGGRSNQQVNVLGHDCEAMEREAPLVPVTEDNLEQQLCICSATKERAPLVSRGGYRVGIGSTFHRRNGKSIPQGLKAWLFFAGSCRC